MRAIYAAKHVSLAAIARHTGSRVTTGGFSSKRLSRVRDVLARHIDAGDGPGAVAVVARRGEVHIDALGKLAFDGAGSTTPMAPDSICRIASMTKPIVAACAMTLVEDCTLRLDDPVDELLPELADMRVLADPNGPLDNTVATRRPITLRDLLTFTLGTGMAVGIDIGAAPGDEPATTPIAELVNALEPPPPPDEYIRRIGDLPLFFQPGERWMYELAADVTVVLVARATGMSFGDALQERICRPLGMNDTAFSVAGESLDRLATAYRRDSDTGKAVVEDGRDGYWSRPPDFESGGGGLVSTANDYFAFASALRAGGTHDGERILSPAAVTLMTTDHLSPAQKAVSGFWPGYFDDFGWGFGMSVRTRRTDLGPCVGSYGWNGFGCAWYNDPAEDMTTILMAQQFNAPQWRLDFLTAAYQAVED